MGNREYFIHALCYLEDPRSAPFLIETLKDCRDNNRFMGGSWVQPLASAMDIPDRDLQLLAVETLGRIKWFRAAIALPKVQELRRKHADDAEFRRICDAVIRHMNR